MKNLEAFLDINVSSTIWFILGNIMELTLWLTELVLFLFPYRLYNTGNIFIKEGFKVVFGLKCFPRYCILSDHSKCNLYTVTGETLKIEQEQQTMKELPNESTLLGK